MTYDLFSSLNIHYKHKEISPGPPQSAQRNGIIQNLLLPFIISVPDVDLSTPGPNALG